jgi:hypothetical protein
MAHHFFLRWAVPSLQVKSSIIIPAVFTAVAAAERELEPWEVA